MKFPDQVGIMVLPDTVFFPHNLIPLYIFEPRYRTMLQNALEGERMFALARANGRENGSGPSPYRYGGVGLIRACTRNKDGTSNVVLQGVSRVKFKTFVQEEPYYIGVPESIEIEDNTDSSSQSEELVSKIIKEVERLQPVVSSQKQLKCFLRELTDYHMLVDIVAGNFVVKPDSKQKLLEMCCLEERLSYLEKVLRNA